MCGAFFEGITVRNYRGPGNFISRPERQPRGLGIQGINTPADMSQGRDIIDQVNRLPITPIPMDKSLVTSTFDSRPINAVDAYMASSSVSVTYPAPS